MCHDGSCIAQGEYWFHKDGESGSTQWQYVNATGSYASTSNEDSAAESNGKIAANTWACNKMGIPLANCVQWDDNVSNITAFANSDLRYVGVRRADGITQDDIDCFKSSGTKSCKYAVLQ
jgi:hypothetical protein